MRVAFACLVLFATGCLDPSAHECGGGIVCPINKVCVASGGCALQEQVDACNSLDENAYCMFAGTRGTCMNGVCVGSLCGNGELDSGETCDNGQTASECFEGGCRADCLKVATCGDGELDCGEECDDGNHNTADGCDACRLTHWTATATVGGSTPATSVGLEHAEKIVLDPNGNIYVAEWRKMRVLRVDAGTGVITAVAGNGSRSTGSTGDGGSATSAAVMPTDIAIDGLGTLFIADSLDHVIRRVDAHTGIISTLIRTPVDGPSAVAVDGQGYVYYGTAHQIVRFDPNNGTTTIIAGSATPTVPGCGNGIATEAALGPWSIAPDAVGNIYIADTNQRCVRMVSPNGMITTVAGAGPNFPGDGGPATAAVVRRPNAIALDKLGNLYIADSLDDHVRRVDAGTHIITTVAGTTGGFDGDAGPATAAKLHYPTGVAVGDAGIFIADMLNRRIRRVDPSGIITTVAGTATPIAHASSVDFGTPNDIAVDGAGRVYVSGFASVRRIDPDGTIRTVAGTGVEGSSLDGGLATNALLSMYLRITVDASGNLFIIDIVDNRLRRVDASTGIITTVTSAITFNDINPDGDVTVDGAGNLYVAATSMNVIYKVDTGGNLTVVAGQEWQWGPDGDGGQATSALLAFPTSVAIDGTGNLYIGDQASTQVRRVDASSGIITTLPNVAGRVAVDAAGNLYTGRSFGLPTAGSTVQRVDATNSVVTTVAGTGTLGFSGDGGPATMAELGDPWIALAPSGDLYIADTPNIYANTGIVRRVDTSGIITTVAGAIEPDGAWSLGQQGHLADPRELVLAPAFTLVAGGTTGTVQIERAATLDVIGRYPQSSPTSSLARYRDRSFGNVGGVAVEANSIYITEGNRLDTVTVVDPEKVETWTIAPLANATGTSDFADGPAQTARFFAPTGLGLDTADHVLLIADTGNHVIRALDLANNTVSTIAGTPRTLGYFGDGLPATVALLYRPEAVTRCANGDVFIADTGNHRVRRIAAGATTITTVLGDGTAASSGEGAPATTFPVDTPRGLACDSAGNLYVTSTSTVRLLPANNDGVVDGTGPVLTIYGRPPKTTFPATVTRCLTGVAVVDATTLHVTDACTGIVVELRREYGP